MIDQIKNHPNWERVEDVDLICEHCNKFIKTVPKNKIFNLNSELCPYCNNALLEENSDYLNTLLEFLNSLDDTANLIRI